MHIKRWIWVPMVALLSQACLFGGAGEQRTLLVDFSHDEFASFFLYNFPERVTVRQGTKLVFRQTWTGEPHTVTGGRLVDETIGASAAWLAFFDAFDGLAASGADIPDPENPGGATIADFADAVLGAEDVEARDAMIEALDDLRDEGVPFPDLRDPPDAPFQEFVDLVDEEAAVVFESGLPWAMDEDDEGAFIITQNAGQPCFLRDGLPPEDQAEPCTEAQQEQPVFDGTHSYYNSGIIPFEGQSGNTYEVPLSADIEPGTYQFYCAVHGPFQRTEVEIVPEEAEVPSQEELSRSAREQIDERAEPLVQTFRQVTRDGFLENDGERIEGPFGGVFARGSTHAAINEFVPRQMTVPAGEPITWKLMGADHSISFDVPEYFPIMEFDDDGTVRMNPKLQPPAGGAPDPPEQEGEGVMRIDGGTYDGEGFWSSGLVSAEPYLEYTVRISKPGTYQYACLLHPAMVATVEVTD